MPRELATPILTDRYWMHLPSGWVWREDRFHRGRVIMRRVSPPGRWPEIRLYRLADDPGTGAARRSVLDPSAQALIVPTVSRCRHCGIETKPWWSYGTRRGVYCLDHVPLFYRLRDRWRERRHP